MGHPVSDLPDLIQRLLAGDAVACGRLLSVVEEIDENSDEVLAAVFPRLGNAYRVGLTGPPGAGKSSLCLHLARAYRSREKKVGVVAVDPTSPISGGAILGDRIRLTDLATDPGVFIRSLASRDSFGGLSLAAGRVADVLDAFGSEIIFFETVGMGQVGHDVRHEASTTVVVMVPESGDGIQVMKAGILELADIIVVNKSDRPGAGELARRLREAPRHGAAGWDTPVVSTCALSAEGVDRLVVALDSHREHLEASGGTGQDPGFWTERFARLVERRMVRDCRRDLATLPGVAEAVNEVRAGRRSLQNLLQNTVKRLRGRHEG